MTLPCTLFNSGAGFSQNSASKLAPVNEGPLIKFLRLLVHRVARQLPLPGRGKVITWLLMSALAIWHLANLVP